MEKQYANPLKKAAYPLVLWQFVVIMGVVIVLSLLQGVKSGWSTLLGGLAYWVPNLLFIWCLFARSHLHVPMRFVLMLFGGEMAKLFIGAVLFVLIVKYVSVNVLAVLAGYIAAILAFWVVTVIYLNRHQGVR